MSKKTIDRRSFVARILGGAAVAGSATGVITGKAQAQKGSGLTDSDSSDTAGSGRGRATGRTDGDSSDIANYGRGQAASTNKAGRTQARTGRTDSDSSDTAGFGRTGRTDSDSGDTANPGRTNTTDSDSSDISNYGRSGKLTGPDPGNGPHGARPGPAQMAARRPGE